MSLNTAVGGNLGTVNRGAAGQIGPSPLVATFTLKICFFRTLKPDDLLSN